MAITLAERTGILKLVAGMFNAAPGSAYLSDMVTTFEANGHNLAKLALDLGGTGAFKSIYPSFQTASEFAAAFLTPLGLQANQEALDYVTTKYNAGVPKALIIVNALAALDASTSTTFADAKAILANKAAVGEYYSTKGLSSTSLATLQSVVATVTADAASVTAADAAINNTSSVGQTFTLTTNIDNLTGTAGNDVFNGSIVGNNSSGTTANPGDLIAGGAGTDTVQFAASDAATGNAAGTISAINYTGVEKILLSQYNTLGSTVNVALADSSLHTVGLSSSNGGLATFTGLTKVVDAEMKNGNSDLTLTFASGNSGTSDVINLAVANQTAGTFTANGIETINVASSISKSAVTLAGSTLATVGISGDTEVKVTLPTTVTKVDASAATGKVTVVSDGITLANITAVGGTGTSDVFSTDSAITASSKLAKITGFETLAVTGAVAVTLDAPVTGLSTIDLTNSNNTTLTFANGYTGATTVKLTGDAGDSVTDNANIALTVNANVADVTTGTTIAAGTGTADVLNLTADNAGATLTNVSGIETINILPNATTASNGTGAIVMVDGNVASGKTLTVNASALTNSSSVFNISAAAETNGKYVITGGAGNDLIVGGNGGNTISGGAGNDSITAGTGNDSINGGDGNDIIDMGGNLTANDTIDGGVGTDTLKVSSLTSSAGFANVTNIENIAITGATNASLSSAIGTSTTFDLSDTAAQSLTFNTGYTGDTTVKFGATGVDAVVNNANVALTVTGNAANFNTATVTGGTGTDVIKMTADGTSVSLSGVSGVETITVVASTTNAANGVTLTTTSSTVAAAKTMTVDASALGSSAVFTFNGADTAGSLVLTGGAGNDVITSGDKAATINGGAGNDIITASDTANINDNVSGGDGNDTIIFNFGTGSLDFNDTVDGGAGTDTLVVGTPISGMLAHVTNVEVLKMAGSGSFGAEAVGFNTFDLTSTGSQTLTLSAGFTGDTTVKMGSDAADSVVNTANVNLTMTGAGAAFNSAVITGGTGTDTIKFTADNAALAIAGTSIDNITVLPNATTASTATGAITIAGTTIATGKTLVVDATALTDSAAVFNFSAAGNTTTGKASITGGAANDIITGTANADTINGGSGDDSITGGAGLDTLTGGAGNDLFVVAQNANGLTFATITDATAGDVVKLATGTQPTAPSVVPTQMTLAAGATTLSDYINAATASTTAGSNAVLNWFQFGGNTYMVVDNNNAGTFTASTDRIIQLQGLVDLSTSTVKADATSAFWQIGTAATSAPGVALSYAITSGATDSLVGGSLDDTFTVSTFSNWASVDTISGGAGNDTIAVTEDSNNIIIDAQFTKVTSVEKLTSVTTGSRAQTITVGTLAQAAGLTTIDLSGDSNDTATITSTMTTGLTVKASFAGALSYTAGTGADSVVGSSAADTFTFGANLTSADTVAGGANTDILKVSGTVADAAFTNVASVETLDLTATSTVTLGAAAQAAGIVTVTNSGNGGVTVNASAYTVALNVTGGTGADTITGGTGADTITGGTGADTFVFAAGASGLPTATNFDTIADFGTGADVIDFGATALTADAGTGTSLTVVAGLVTGGAANLAAFVTALGSSTTTTAGSTLVYNDGTNSYLFISDGTAGLGANDVLVKLTGVTGLTTGATFGGGDITAFA